MKYAQFYQKSAISDKIIEASGDRSVIIYDGRWGNIKIRYDAEIECRERGFIAFAIFQGETFSRSRKVSELFVLK